MRVCLLSTLALCAAASPEQLSLALTEGGPAEMSITWASQMPYSAATSQGAVTWRPTAGGAPQTAPAVVSSYSAGLGWPGTIFKAIMTGLTPGTKYTYSVTDASGNTSASFSFNAAPALPAADASLRVAVLADMGTIELMGWATAAALIAEHAVTPFDLSLIAGDLSYATVDPPSGIEFQHLWDAWSDQNEPFAATAPFMMTVGNHESTPGTVTNASGGPYPQQYAAFSARYRMPQNGQGNFYFSYASGPAFFVSVDGEHDYVPGSAQYAWLEATLAGIDRATFPWVFAVMHHPILSSDSDETPDHIPGGPRSVVFEPLFLKYAVDVVFQGHQHNYERTASVFNGTVVGMPDANNTYHAPTAPIYIVQGNSGAVLDGDKWIAPTPWSLVRDGSDYGFGSMTLSTREGMRVLDYTFTGAVDKTLHDHWTVIKPVA